MSDDLAKRLRVDVFYGDERLHNLSRHNPLHMEAADRIEELDGIIRQGRERIEELVSMVNSKADRIEELEAKLAKFAKAATRVHDSYWNSTDGIIVGMFDLGEALHEVSTTLAELKGETDD
jgi:chromosome segregation ATPase